MTSVAMLARPLRLEADAVVDRAVAMRGWLREREAATNAARLISGETVEAFKKAGLFRLCQPARFSGLGVEFESYSRVVEEITLGCASSGWVYGVVSLHSLFLAAWPTKIQDEVWSRDPDALISSSLAARPVTKVAGGYRLNGSWSFSSGCEHATWAMIGGSLPDAAPVLMLVPIADATIVDDWHTLGLRGTGSKTLRFDDLFVPEERAIPHSLIHAGSRGAVKPGGEIWDHLPCGMFGTYSFNCVILGLAQRAINITADMLRNRVSRGVRLGDVESHRMKLAEAASIVDTSRFQLHEGFRRHVENMRRGMSYGKRETAPVHRDAAVTVRRLRDAVISLCEISGGWVYDSDPMQQILRDVLTGSTHRSAVWEAMVLPAADAILDQGPRS